MPFPSATGFINFLRRPNVIIEIIEIITRSTAGEVGRGNGINFGENTPGRDVNTATHTDAINTAMNFGNAAEFTGNFSTILAVVAIAASLVSGPINLH